jgi:hypothetical protein
MTVIDYSPALEGVTGDPLLEGGEVILVRLYSSPDYAGSYLGEAGPAIEVSAGVYRFDIGDVQPGRYWPLVQWKRTEAGPYYTDKLDYIDLPTRPDLVVSPETVAVAAGMSLPITNAQRVDLTNHILASQGRLAAGLNRETLVPVERTLNGLWPLRVFPLNDVRAWGIYEDDWISISTWTAQIDGTFSVTYQVGLDGRAEPAIRDWVARDAAVAWRSSPAGQAVFGRVIASASTEGQAISYERNEGSSAGRGSLTAPSLEELKRFRRFPVYQRRGVPVHR